MKKSMASIVTEASRIFDLYAASTDSNKLQAKLAAWQSRNFGACTLEQQTLGVCEEAGELAHATLKHAQKIRGFADEQAFRESAADAVADCTVFLMQVCTILRLDFYTLVRRVAENVMERDFTKDAVMGGEGDGKHGVAKTVGVARPGFRCPRCGQATLIGTSGVPWVACTDDNCRYTAANPGLYAALTAPAPVSDPTFPGAKSAPAFPLPNEPSLFDRMERAESILTVAGIPLPDKWASVKGTVSYSPPWNDEIRYLWIRVGQLLHDAYGDPHADGVLPAVVKVHRLFVEAFGTPCPKCLVKDVDTCHVVTKEGGR